VDIKSNNVWIEFDDIFPDGKPSVGEELKGKIQNKYILKVIKIQNIFFQKRQSMKNHALAFNSNFVIVTDSTAKKVPSKKSSCSNIPFC